MIGSLVSSRLPPIEVPWRRGVPRSPSDPTRRDPSANGRPSPDGSVHHRGKRGNEAKDAQTLQTTPTLPASGRTRNARKTREQSQRCAKFAVFAEYASLERWTRCGESALPALREATEDANPRSRV